MLSREAEQMRAWTRSKMWIAWSNSTDSVTLQKVMDSTESVTYFAILLGWRQKSDALCVYIWHRQTFNCLLTPVNAFVMWHHSRKQTIHQGDKCSSTWRKFFLSCFQLPPCLETCLFEQRFLNTKEFSFRCHFVVMKRHYSHSSELCVAAYFTRTTGKFKWCSVHDLHILVPMFLK